MAMTFTLPATMLRVARRQGPGWRMGAETGPSRIQGSRAPVLREDDIPASDQRVDEPARALHVVLRARRLAQCQMRAMASECRMSPVGC
jgi:hypothetical protein